jgi:hypothetical protein
MVEDRRSPGEEPSRDSRKSPWLTRLLLGAAGVTAALRLLLATPRPGPGLVQEQPTEEEIRHPNGRIEHPRVRFEHSDANFSPVLIILIVVVGIATLHFASVWWFFKHYAAHEAAIKQSPFLLQPGPSDQLPTEPRLDPVNRMAAIEKGNVNLIEASRKRILNSYGTLESGYVHIPIQRAMDVLANKLPARPKPAGNAQKEDGLVDAGEPNSGRMFRGEPRWFER